MVKCNRCGRKTINYYNTTEGALCKYCYYGGNEFLTEAEKANIDKIAFKKRLNFLIGFLVFITLCIVIMWFIILPMSFQPVESSTTLIINYNDVGCVDIPLQNGKFYDIQARVIQGGNVDMLLMCKDSYASLRERVRGEDADDSPWLIFYSYYEEASAVDSMFLDVNGVWGEALLCDSQDFILVIVNDKFDSTVTVEVKWKIY